MRSWSSVTMTCTCSPSPAAASTARRSDTLDEILRAPDRDALLEWLATRQLAHFEAGDLLVHAGVVPQWTVETTLGLAREVESALRNDPRHLFDHMYGDEPDRWSADLEGTDRLRFAINVLTRMRVCTNEGRINLRLKGKPPRSRLGVASVVRCREPPHARQSRRLRSLVGARSRRAR